MSALSDKRCSMNKPDALLCDPTQKAEDSRLRLSSGLDSAQRSKLGQFMTPTSVATTMAKMFEDLPEDIRLLDAGAGMGALTAAFVEEALSRLQAPRSIAVTAYEVDADMAALLSETLAGCQEACEAAGVSFSATVIQDDYILRSTEPLLASARQFNAAILNPPYAKINSASRWRAALSSVGIETVNLYSAFVALALDQLEDGGQLIAITPRSFCNGTYYEPFRRKLLSESALLGILVYESRRTAFRDDDVLQENIIFHVIKGVAQPDEVRMSTDIGQAASVPFTRVVRPGDRHSFIRLGMTDDDASLAERVQALPCKLTDLGIKASTGRVVDFRAREHLRPDPEEGTAPLIYPTHLDGGGVNWPKPGNKKPNAIAANAETEFLLVPGGVYVLTKRFTAKEERRRVVASVYRSEGPVGFENHLNYFHAGGVGLSEEIAVGLAAFLNSTAVDLYFRQFSGHTQVNATDLRNLHYPSAEQLAALGRAAPIGQDAIDEAVEALL